MAHTEGRQSLNLARNNQNKWPVRLHRSPASIPHCASFAPTRFSTAILLQMRERKERKKKQRPPLVSRCAATHARNALRNSHLATTEKQCRSGSHVAAAYSGGWPERV